MLCVGDTGGAQGRAADERLRGRHQVLETEVPSIKGSY